MKNFLKNFFFLVMLLSFISCGKWWAEYRGEIRKIEMDKEGQALLLKAENEKKVAIEEARAKLESAKMLASAEVERAKGVAEANKIIGDSLKNNESYLRYLFIDKLGQNDVIYIPTEAGLPILEAGKRRE
jgi:regulator of protease activity HflC (stomatin/prohibitin superfamily)